MILALWILTLTIFMVVSLFSLRWGVMLYLIGTLIFPTLWLGETTVRLELIYCLWLIFMSFLRSTSLGGTFKWHPILSRYGLFLMVIALSTMIALTEASAESTSLVGLLVSFYGILRPLLVMFVIQDILLDVKFVSRILRAFLWLAIPIALLSVGQTLGVDIAQQLTLQGYTSPSRTPIFNLLKEQGLIIRSAGIFESPVYNAVYWLLVLITTGFALVNGLSVFGSRWFLYLMFGLAIIAGITTLSSTFLVGAVFALVILAFLLGYRYPRRFFWFTVISVGMLSLFLTIVLAYLMKQPAFGGNLSYQVNRILSGTLFASRYDPNSGFLKETFEAIQQRPIVGWGLLKQENVFVGDSIYVVVLYTGGIMGLSAFLWVIFSILKYAWWSKSRGGIQSMIGWIVLLWTLLLLVAGVGSPSFFIPRLQEWYWALVGVVLSFSSQAHQHKRDIVRQCC